MQFVLVLLLSKTIPLPAEMRGGAPSADGRTLLVWGEGLYRVDLRSGKVRRLAVGSFRQPGCVAEKGLVLQSGDKLVWLTGPRFETLTVIDTGAGIADCMEATLLGRRGILVTWRGLQVRHYLPPETTAERWPYREIYSFYTASYQAGLLLRDVDEDGRPDLVCGNYWIQSPQSYDLPWRLYAINTYNEEPMSARLKLAWLERRRGFPLLVVTQAAMPAGRVAVFERPADPKQLWKEQRLDELPEPRALAAADLDGDGLTDFVTGDLWIWRQKADGFEKRLAASGQACTAVWVIGGDVVCLGRAGMAIMVRR